MTGDSQIVDLFVIGGGVNSVRAEIESATTPEDMPQRRLQRRPCKIVPFADGSQRPIAKAG